MRVASGEFEVEGFTSGYGLLFENGLMLKTGSILWKGDKGQEEAARQFEEVLNAIKAGTLVFDNSIKPDSTISEGD